MTELGNIQPDRYIKCPNCGYLFADIYTDTVDDDGTLCCYKCRQKVRLPQFMADEIRKIKERERKR